MNRRESPSLAGPLRHLALVATLATGCLGGSDPGRGSGELSQLDTREVDSPDAAEARCSLTQGYWKTHEEAWPVGALDLGAVSYAQAKLMSILQTPVRGNGLVALAHQLIAAKLNVAAGVNDLAAGVIDRADEQIGELVVPPVGEGWLDPGDTSLLVETLDAFNNGDMSGLCHGE